MACSSRLRPHIATIFDVFCEIAGAEANEGESGTSSPQPLILQKYPEDFNDESILKSLSQFAFPCGAATKDGSDGAVQLFSFVLTDSSSAHTFGFCRYTPRTNTCITIISGYPWTNVFYQLLNHISIVMNNGTQADVDSLLTRVYHSDAPPVGDKLRLEMLGGRHYLDLEVPDLSRLPTLKDDKFMLEFYNAVTPRQMIAIYSSLLKERRVMFTGRKLGQLSSCVRAAASLLYPMEWQSLFIPVLPRALRDMIAAPMPYLIGVPKQNLVQRSLSEAGDAMIIDLDEKTLHGAHDDFSTLPSELQAHLKSSMKAGIDMGDSLSRIFLKANLLLFGQYRVGLTRSSDESAVTWDKERFLAELRPSYQTFLGALLGADGVQYLERFIAQRLLALNTGTPINDEFEKEVGNIDNRQRGQVRENANDVIGALKDKVSSIALRDKLRVAKETRKARNRSRSAKRKMTTPTLHPTEPTSGHPTEVPEMGIGSDKITITQIPTDKLLCNAGRDSKNIDPLSFDNIQWSHENGADSRNGSGDPSPEPTSVPDLIDLGDTPTAPQPPTTFINAKTLLPISKSEEPPDFSDLLTAPSLMEALPPSQPPFGFSSSNPFIAASNPNNSIYTTAFNSFAMGRGNQVLPIQPPRPSSQVPPRTAVLQTREAPPRPSSAPKPPPNWERFD